MEEHCGGGQGLSWAVKPRGEALSVINLLASLITRYVKSASYFETLHGQQKESV